MPFDYVIVGGGLQAGLLVLALRHRQPAATIAVVERADTLGGNHTWSFHEADVPAGAWPVVAPLVGASWPAYRVRFPGHSRVVRTAYHSILSDRFDAVVRAALADSGHALRLGAEAVSVTSTQVTSATGEVLAGRCVIDARGAERTRAVRGRTRPSPPSYLHPSNSLMTPMSTLNSGRR